MQPNRKMQKRGWFMLSTLMKRHSFFLRSLNKRPYSLSRLSAATEVFIPELLRYPSYIRGDRGVTSCAT